MPIRLNLLAEQQYQEELRRKDPVKRGYYVAGGLVALMILWVMINQVGVWRTSSRLSSLQTELKQYDRVIATTKTNKSTLRLLIDNVSLLGRLATNRVLSGSVLNSMQYSIINNIELTRLRLLQTNSVIPAVKGTQGKPSIPASAHHTTLLLLDAQHVGRSADVPIGEFRKKLRTETFLKQYLTNDNMIKQPTQSPEQADPLDTNRIVVLFTLECRFPDKVY